MGVANGVEAISNFRMIVDQNDLFGPVALVPACWRALNEIPGASRALARITVAVNASWRQALVAPCPGLQSRTRC
jgi:hypothetical protein